MSRDDGGPAFPSLEVYEGYDSDREAYVVKSDVATGMSLRDWFAGRALTGMLAQPANAQNVNVYDDQQNAADWAYEFADAMLKAREKQGS